MSNIETIYGDTILSSELNDVDKYIVITDKVPWRLCQDYFSSEPVDVIMLNTLDKATLDKLISMIPEEVEFVGLGGGTVLDAAKYFAYLRGKTPILVPTIISTNAPFSDFMSITNGKGFRTGFKKKGWPKRVIVDYKLIGQAEPRFNRAGYGDLLFMQTTLNDWKLASATGKDVSFDPDIEKIMNDMIEESIESASVIGEMGPEGIERLTKLIEDSTTLMMKNLSIPINAGSEHLFAWNLEVTTGKHFIHGEIVALGILISSYLHRKHYNTLKTALDEAKVIYDPEQLGISWDEIKQTLLTIQQYNREVRQFHTIFDEIEWTPKKLNEIRDLIFA